MAIICRDYRLLFIQSPRTGCTAIAKLLKERFGGEDLPANDILDVAGNFGVPRKHCTIGQLLQERLIPEDYESKLITFTSIRNPYDSLVSLYVKKRDKYQPYLADKGSWVYRIPGYVDDMDFCRTHTFADWISKHYGVGVVQRILGRGQRSLYERYTRGVHQILMFEHLQRDFERLMRGMNIEGDMNIPKFNATPRRSEDFRTYYAERTRRTVEYVFRRDLERYGYSFDAS